MEIKRNLDGIEALADVTDTANVSAAGALMESEVTNLAQVKAFDSSEYATAAQGLLADSSLQDASVFATAAQGLLADSAQQPPIEGAFVDGDKTKLDGIEALADVTDTANVSAAGALMESEVTNLAQVKAFDSSAYATAAQGIKADNALSASSVSAFGATLIDDADSSEAKNTLGLAAVASSGDYSDLTNVPSTAGAAIYNNAGSPALDTGITASEVNTLLGLGTAATTASTDYALSSNNSSDVTLSGLYDYLTLVGQTITLDLITNDDLAGSITDSKLNQITTADKVAGSSVQLATNSALTDATGLDVTVDDSSIENSSGTLQVKALGVTNTMLAGSITDSKLNQITTADKVAGSSVQLATNSALTDATGLDVTVDDSSIENSSGTLQVKALGVTNAMLAGSITDSKLNQITTADKVAGSSVQLATNSALTDATGLDVTVDDSSIENSSGTLQVKALGVTNAMLAGSITDSKLNQITTADKVAGSSVQLATNSALTDATGLDVTVDDSSIENSSGTLQVKALGVTNAMLAGSITDSKLNQITTADKVAGSSVQLATNSALTDATGLDVTVDDSSIENSSGTLQVKALGVTNAMLAGSITDSKLNQITTADKVAGSSVQLATNSALTDATGLDVTVDDSSIENSSGTLQVKALGVTNAMLAGSITDSKLNQITTADKVAGSSVQLATNSALTDATGLDVTVDDSSIENSSGTLQVKALGVTNAMLAGSITDSKLNQITTADKVAGSSVQLATNSALTDATGLDVTVDDSSIENSSGTLQVKALGVTNAMLAGSITDSKLNQITTADKVAGSSVQLATNSALTDATGLDVTVDDSSIENSSGTLQVKALGVTNAMLAGSITDSKLNQITTADKVAGSSVQLATNSALTDATGLDVTVDDSSIENSSGTLQVKALGVTNTMLAGSITDSKLNQITTADKVAGSSVQLATNSALTDATGLDVTVDDSSIENSSGTLQVKALGVTNAMLAGSITDSKLNQITTADKVAGSSVQLATNSALTDATGLDVTVDDSSIENSSGTLQVKALGVTNAMLAGSITDSKLNQITTADKVAGSSVQLATNSALTDATGLDVTVDDSSIENSSGTLQVKALGVTNAMLANATIDLAAKVTGVLPIANGGTGATNADTENSALNSLGIFTGTGTILSGNGTTVTIIDSNVTSSSKIFLTLTSDTDGGPYFVDNLASGSFRVTAATIQAGGTFNYLVINIP